MRSNITTKVLSILFLLTIGLSTSCNKEHDLVSDFVVTEKVEIKSSTLRASSELQAIVSKESKLTKAVATTPY